MGYIIPVQPIQSQNYANRLLMDDYNFAFINNIDAIKMKSIFDKRLEEQQQKHEVKKEKQQVNHDEPSILPLFKGFIQPNPVNLSLEISKINGKGQNFNYYI